MGYLDQIHQREAAEERQVETPTTVVETPKVEEPPKEEPPKVEEPPKEEPPKGDGVVENDPTPAKEEPPKQDEPKQQKDLSGFTKEEKAAFAFKKQLAKRESKFEEALKSRDAEIESLKKSIEELKAPKEMKKRADFDSDDEFIDYLTQQGVDKRLAERDAKAAEEKAAKDKEEAEAKELNEITQAAIEDLRNSISEAFTDEKDTARFKANLSKATKNGLGGILDSVPPVKSFLLQNGTTGVRVLDRILDDKNTFNRVFRPNIDPISMLIELHAIAHEVNTPEPAPAQEEPEVTETAPKKQAIGRPGQGSNSGAPGELHGHDLIMHMRKVAKGGRRL